MSYQHMMRLSQQHTEAACTRMLRDDDVEGTLAQLDAQAAAADKLDSGVDTALSHKLQLLSRDIEQEEVAATKVCAACGHKLRRSSVLDQRFVGIVRNKLRRARAQLHFTPLAVRFALVALSTTIVSRSKAN